jgi:hypothetical protein
LPAAPRIAPLTLVTGHYGCGKTNLSLNLAIDVAAAGAPVTLVDLDIVNPYFRSSEYTAMLGSRGVRVIAPTFAGTTLDVPSLPASIGSVFEAEGTVIFDVGGDDAGATALGRFSADIARREYGLLYVVNMYRNMTGTAAEAVALLGEIEGASHLKATAVVNNSHLQSETTMETVVQSLPYARAVADELGLPLLCTTVPRRLAAELAGDPSAAGFVEAAYPIDIHVRTPWDEAPGEG